jgi:hypothetical protein
MKKLIIITLLFTSCHKDNAPYKLLHKGESCKIDKNSFGTGFYPVGRVTIDSIYLQDNYNMYFWVGTDQAGHIYDIPNDDLYDCK